MSLVSQKQLGDLRVVLRKPTVDDASSLALYWAGPQSAHLRRYLDPERFTADYDSILATHQKSLGSMSSDGPWTMLIMTRGGIFPQGFLPRPSDHAGPGR